MGASRYAELLRSGRLKSKNNPKLLYHKNMREYNPNLIQGIRGVSAAPILRGLSGDRRNFLDKEDIRAYTIKVY